MRISSRSAAMIALVALMIGGCQTTPKNEAKRETLDAEASTTVERFQREDPGLRDMLNRGYGYAIFPNVGKGGIIVGGAYGKGLVNEQGQMVGYADLTQATIGAQLGGQSFAELISFENRAAMERFKSNQLAFSANASAVAIKAGAAATARYENGVAVFTQPNGGLMFEASVGGQKFTFVPNAQADRTMAATRTSSDRTGDRTVTETRIEDRTTPDRTRTTDGGGVKVDVNVDKK